MIEKSKWKETNSNKPIDNLYFEFFLAVSWFYTYFCKAVSTDLYFVIILFI